MKERILITVKTYPKLSSKYAELVCTAGVNEKGEWRRIYPIQFRQLQKGQKYKKYQWIETEIKKSSLDRRPESYRIIDHEKLVLDDSPLSTKNQWEERRTNFIDKVPLHRDLGNLIKQAHRNTLSLAHFQPSEWLGFTCQEVEGEWDKNKWNQLEEQKRQLDFFKDPKTVEQDFAVVKKLPYKFSYRIKDCFGKESTMMIEDWEIGALYHNCLKKYGGDPQVAKDKVRQKYWDEFMVNTQYDTSLVLGTTLAHHNKKAPNPFVIISVVPTPRKVPTPKKVSKPRNLQMNLF